MNKQGQIPASVIPIIGGILLLFVLGTIIIPQMSNAFHQINCEDENQKINTLNNQLNSLINENSNLKNQLDKCFSDLRDSERNCLIKLNDSSNECNKRIQNVTENFSYNIYIQKTTNFLVLFTLQLFLIIPLTISLFKFVFSVKVSKEGEKLINFIKFIMIIILVVILIIYIQNFFNSLKSVFI